MGGGWGMLLGSGKGWFVVCDRRATLCACGFAGALHLPLAELPRRRAALPRERPIVFYRLAGARSAPACRFVAQQGRGPLYNLEGGIAAWARCGLALTD